MRRLCVEHHGQWTRLLKSVQWAINTTRNRRTGISPWECVNGRPPRHVFYGLLMDAPKMAPTHTTPRQFGRQVAWQLVVAWDLVHRTQRHFLTATERKEDRAGPRFTRFAAGSWVWRRTDPTSKVPQRNDGPFVVVRDATDDGDRTAYVLHNQKTGARATVPADHIRPYIKSDGDKDDTHNSYCMHCGEGGPLILASPASGPSRTALGRVGIKLQAAVVDAVRAHAKAVGASARSRIAEVLEAEVMAHKSVTDPRFWMAEYYAGIAAAMAGSGNDWFCNLPDALNPHAHRRTNVTRTHARPRATRRPAPCVAAAVAATMRAQAPGAPQPMAMATEAAVTTR